MMMMMVLASVLSELYQPPQVEELQEKDGFHQRRACGRGNWMQILVDRCLISEDDDAHWPLIEEELSFQCRHWSHYALLVFSLRL